MLVLEGVLEELEKVLRAHAPAGDRLDGICVHGPSFGTRSSGVFALADAQWQFWYAEGPPCTTKHRNYTRLLDELRQTDGSEESGIEENR